MTNLLKLRAADAEDVQVISAILQDAIVPVCDMLFHAEDKDFIMVTQRLRREEAKDGACERICCAVTVRGVTEVQTQGIDRQQQGRMLDLLAVIVEPALATLNLVFADNARIRLVLAKWSVTVEDFGETWPALCTPCHEEVAQK